MTDEIKVYNIANNYNASSFILLGTISPAGQEKGQNGKMLPSRRKSPPPPPQKKGGGKEEKKEEKKDCLE